MRRRMRVAVGCALVAACLAGASSAAAAPVVCETGCFFKEIQPAINAAQPGATITIGAGSYYENLVVDKPLTLRGAGPTKTFIFPAESKPVCSPGSLCGGSASNIVLVKASNVTITNLALEGDNPKLTSGVIVGGKDIDARNGIITDYEAGAFSGLTVAKVAVSDVYRRGIFVEDEASPGATFNVNHDTVKNVQAEEPSIAIFNRFGAGQVAYNKVSEANDAISANWSSGTQFVHNAITKSGSGVHTDNNGGAGGSADDIKENTVRECKTDGYGIFVFVPYVSASVERNKVAGCAVALAAFGSAVSGQGATFTANVLNGTGATTSKGAPSYGAYLTTDQLGFAFGDLTATLTGNFISHFSTGLFVTQTTPTEGQPAGGQATVTASPNDSFFANGTGAEGGPGTVVNAKEDWWGCAQGPNMGGRCNTALGTVTFTPWLTVKP